MKLYGPVVYIRFEKGDRTFHLFGDHHRPLAKCNMVEHINAIAPDLLCLEFTPSEFRALDDEDRGKPGALWMLNRLAHAIRASEVRAKSHMFDTRKPNNNFIPFPTSNSANEWRTFSRVMLKQALPSNLIREGRVEIAAATRFAESVAFRELILMDKTMVDRVLRRPLKTVAVVCGTEHVLDISHLLFERGYKLVMCNDEFKKHSRAFGEELRTLKYPQDRYEMQFDRWFKTPAYITVGKS